MIEALGLVLLGLVPALIGWYGVDLIRWLKARDIRRDARLLRRAARTPDPQESRQLTLLSIRNSFSALGFDTEDLSDDELEEGLHRFGQQVASCGITAQEAADALYRLAS